ncbi:hypothetical protein [Alloactinosynnema sp. L-07]|nr:hypothetical protein [Alloactinosynnema sp. L-07]
MHIRWGFTRGITLGIRLGILLERHPLRAAKTPVRGPVGGSAGIPDSLGHKPVNTSGRTGGRLPALSALRSLPSSRCVLSVLTPPSLLFPEILSFISGASPAFGYPLDYCGSPLPDLRKRAAISVANARTYAGWGFRNGGDGGDRKES